MKVYCVSVIGNREGNDEIDNEIEVFSSKEEAEKYLYKSYSDWKEQIELLNCFIDSFTQITDYFKIVYDFCQSSVEGSVFEKEVQTSS